IAGLRALVSGGGTHRPRRSAPRGRYARLRAGRPAMPSVSGPPTVAGRWSLVPERETDPTRRAHARTESFLERHGVLTRGALDTERVTGGFTGYQVLRGMADSGQVIRGYVVEGLGAAQFAALGAVDRLRSFAEQDPLPGTGEAVVLAASDPAQPYGAALRWPVPVGKTPHRPARKAGAVVALVAGSPVLYLERGGRSLLSFTDDPGRLRIAAGAIADLVRSGRIGPLVVKRADGEHALSSELATVLHEAGFRETPQGMRLRG
ncbi:MAG: DEAD/DEAH box helicase, partial [Actinophytocola sp.]|nr:DEAD/DEAH box helicase [Actinophytocola sp.]